MEEPAANQPADQRATWETVVDSDDEYTKEEVGDGWDEVPLSGEGDGASATGHSPGGGRSNSGARADTSTTATEGNVRGGPPSEGSGKPPKGEPKAPTSSTAGDPGVPVWTCNDLPPRFLLPPKMSFRCKPGGECTHISLLSAGVKRIETFEPHVDIPSLSRELGLTTHDMLVFNLGSEHCSLWYFRSIFSRPELVAPRASSGPSVHRHTEMDAAAYGQHDEPGMLRVVIRDFDSALFTAWDVSLSPERPIINIDTNVNVDATNQGPKTAPLKYKSKKLDPRAKVFKPRGAPWSLALSGQVVSHLATKSVPKGKRQGAGCPQMAKSFSTSY